MATKNQAKAAIDALVVLVKADIDNMLPAGVNIRDGELFPNPNRWGLLIEATDLANAETIANAIINNLVLAGRPTPFVTFARRSDDPRAIEIRSAPAYYKIFWGA